MAREDGNPCKSPPLYCPTGNETMIVPLGMMKSSDLAIVGCGDPQSLCPPGDGTCGDAKFYCKDGVRYTVLFRYYSTCVGVAFCTPANRTSESSCEAGYVCSGGQRMEIPDGYYALGVAE